MVKSDANKDFSPRVKALLAAAAGIIVIFATKRYGVEGADILSLRWMAGAAWLAVPVTSGTKGNLYLGKRGVFQDTEGNEWDALVVQVIENPISVRQAWEAALQGFTLDDYAANHIELRQAIERFGAE